MTSSETLGPERKGRVGTRAALSTVLGLLALVLFGRMAAAAPAPFVTPAAPPITIDSPVVDPDGILTPTDVKNVEKAIGRAAEAGVNVVYVLVPDFSGADPTDWCSSSGDISDLSLNTVIFVLAYEERDTSWCTNMTEDNGIISDSEVDDAWDAALDRIRGVDPITSNALTNAGVSFADVIASKASSGSTVPSSPSDTAPAAGTKDESRSGILELFIFFGVSGLLLWLLNSNAKKKKRLAAHPTSAPGEDQEALVAKARQQLFYADEALRSAKDEAAFAEAEFGYLRSDSLRNAVAAAQAGLDRAFTLLTQMNETQDVSKQAALAQQILAILDKTMPPVHAAQTALKGLRDKQLNAEQYLRELRARAQELSAEVPRAQTTLDRLAAKHSANELASLVNKPAQVAELIQSANELLGSAQAQITTDRQAAADTLEDASGTLAEAQANLLAIQKAEGQLAQANQALTATMASVTSDLQDVERLAKGQASLAPLVETARRALAQGELALAGSGDPITALADLKTADDALDQALAPLRSAEQQRQRDNALAAERINAAQAVLDQANSQLQLSRGYASLDARQAVTSAQTSLSQARSAQANDPQRAIKAADTAFSQGQRALMLIRNTPAQAQWSPSQSRRRNRSNSMLWGMLMGSMMSSSRGRSRSSGYRTSGFGGPRPPQRRSSGGSRGRSSFGGSTGGFRGGGGGGGFRGGGGGFSGGGGGGRGKF